MKRTSAIVIQNIKGTLFINNYFSNPFIQNGNLSLRIRFVKIISEIKIKV